MNIFFIKYRLRGSFTSYFLADQKVLWMIKMLILPGKSYNKIGEYHVRRQWHILISRNRLYSAFYATFYSFNVFVLNRSLINFLKNKGKKKFLIAVSVKHNSNWSTFPKDCNKRWLNFSTSLWSSYRVHDMCIKTHIFRLRKKSDKIDWYIFSLIIKL